MIDALPFVVGFIAGLVTPFLVTCWKLYREYGWPW